LALLLIGSCGQQKLDSNGLDSKSIEDAGTTTSTTFTVSSTSPDNGSTGVSRTGATITITFSDSVSTGYSAWDSSSSAEASCSGSVFNWKVVHVSSDNFVNCLRDNGTVSGSTITLNLNATLSATTTYKVKILKTSLDGAETTKSTSGTQLSSDHNFAFTTGS